MTDPHARPLDGVRVLELAHLIAGPTGGMYLADMGADVIKVESREAPDASRSVYGVSRAGEGILHLTVNRNKRALCLDLQKPAGRETFYRVVKPPTWSSKAIATASRRSSASTTPPSRP